MVEVESRSRPEEGKDQKDQDQHHGNISKTKTLKYSKPRNRLYAQLTSAFCETGRIASGPGLLHVLHEFFCGFTQDNLKGASKD